jgi:cytochrome c
MKLQFRPKLSHVLKVCLLSAALTPSVIAQTPVTAPEENRFTKNVLLEKLDEPTELVVLEDQRVLFTERKGKVKLYNPKKPNTYKVVANLPVYIQQEYGLMGINVDPDFKQNKWVYLYYSRFQRKPILRSDWCA